MATIQHIQKNTGTLLLVIVWLFSLTGCRDFQDNRTPYKSFVTVALRPINKADTLTISQITDTATADILYQETDKTLHTFALPLMLNLPLKPYSDIVQFTIYSSSATSPDILTITYKKEAVLISHQCGCAYKYLLQEVTSTGAEKCKIINKALSTLNESSIDVQMYF